MKCLIVLFIFFATIFFFNAAGFADAVWERMSGIKEADIKEVSVDTYNGGVIYASSKKTLYRSEDSGNTWQAVFFAKGDTNSINFIGISEYAVFICTERGVFRSLDGKSGWKRIFKGIGRKENCVLHIAFPRDKRIYLGTRAGLFVSKDNGSTWKKDSGEAGNISIKWIAFLEEDIFLATEKGVYKSSGSAWKRIFVTTAEETEYDRDKTDEAISAIKPVNSIMAKGAELFLATDSGIFLSRNKRYNWDRFTTTGLSSQKVKRLLFKENIFALTNGGVFVFYDKEKIWRPLYKGIDTKGTASMAMGSGGALLVATSRGLYRSTYRSSASLHIADLGIFDNEPSINDVQKAAIEYAEVYPDKIQIWRRRARIKALLPELSVDYDKTINYDSGADRYYVGPYDWGVSIKWDLGEILWNKDQTSIDVRSKLMVQLRDDILDEITRTYFERRRLQLEMQLQPPANLKQRLENNLRIQELTADLDALTGGYFSRQLHYLH